MAASRSDKQIALDELTPEPETAFPADEFRQRRRRIRAMMEAAGIDLLYLTAPESRFYVDGYNSDWYQAQAPKGWHALSGVAIRVDSDDVMSFELQVNIVLVRSTTVETDARIKLDGDERPMAQFIADNLADKGWLSGRAALEFYSYRPNRAVSHMMEEALLAGGARSVVDGSDILRDARGVKSPRELACVRKAALIGEAGMRAAMGAIRPGVTELDVYGEIVHAMIAAGGEHPGKAVSCASGLKTLTTDAQTSAKKIAAGEIVTIDICGCWNRYHTNYARTFSVGEPHPDVARRVRLAAGGFDALAEVLEPGVLVNDATRRMKEYWIEAGIWEERWWAGGGYDMGIAFPPDWVGPRIYDPDIDHGERRFGPGSVCNVESDYFLPRKAGLSLIIDTFAVDETSAELLHTVPRELNVVGD